MSMSTKPDLFPSFDSDDVAHIAIGMDRILAIIQRHPAGETNDAGETFEHVWTAGANRKATPVKGKPIGSAIHVEVFDSDFNFLGTIARLNNEAAAISLVPTFILLAEVFYGPA